METYVVRVWLPDRPGALGAVASRIGAVRGDVAGIEILETGGGLAVDELVVALPRAALVDLLVGEIEEVDGVRVEEVRPLGTTVHDPRLDALETAAILVAATNLDELLSTLCTHVAQSLRAEWVAVTPLDHEAARAELPAQGAARARAGTPPSEAWLAAFVAGNRAAAGNAVASNDPNDQLAAVDLGTDVVWAPLPGAGLAVVTGRDATPFRSRERQALAALARIADTRALSLGELPSPVSS